VEGQQNRLVRLADAAHRLTETEHDKEEKAGNEKAGENSAHGLLLSAEHTVPYTSIQK
jgi:hypothetical protein